MISLAKKGKKMSFEDFCKKYNDHFVSRGVKKLDEMRANWEKETGKNVELKIEQSKKG